jgi:hypothetical protein
MSPVKEKKLAYKYPNLAEITSQQTANSKVLSPSQ